MNEGIRPHSLTRVVLCDKLATLVIDHIVRRLGSMDCSVELLSVPCVGGSTWIIRASQCHVTEEWD